ncbi:MAG: COX15/CtaA family protein [Gammaproteobacteria bacterium]
MGRQDFLSKLGLFASFFALGIIALGAFTRLIDAGLGCPDWPGCYGMLTVPVSEMAREAAATQYPNAHLVAYKAWTEMIHRYFVGGGLSIFILAIVTKIFMQRECRARKNVIAALLLLLLLVYQVLLGRLTVTLKLLPIIVSQHLLGGYFILSMLWLIYLMNRPIKKKLRSVYSIKKKGKFVPLLVFACIGLFLLILQIMLGAWTSTNYASLSCPDFPFCVNDQAMQFEFKRAFDLFAPIGINYEGGVLSAILRKTIQMSHRFGAVVLTTYLFIFSTIAMSKLKKQVVLVQFLYLILGLLCIQLCLGISNVIFKLPLVTALAHTIVAAILLLAMITFIFKLVRSE